MNTPAHSALSFDDDAIERLLRDDAYAAREHVDIGNFNEMVMARLAAAGHRSPIGMGLRLTVIGGAIALAGCIALFAGSGTDYLIDALMDAATETFTASVTGATAIMLAVGNALFIAIQAER